MNVTAGDRPATLVPADFPTNKGGLCSKGWSSTELLDHPERLLRPLVRATPGDRTSPLVETTWDDALGRLVGAIRAHPGPLRPRRRRLLRRRLADQRAGLPVRQVRPRRAAHQRHRLQRPLLHVVGRGRGQPGLRPRPRHAVPAQRHRRGRRRRPGRQQPGRHDAAGDAVLRRRPRAAAPSTSSSTPGARRPPATPPCTCSRCPAPTSRWPTACCTSRSPRGWSTRSTSPRAPPASTRSGPASAPTGPTASSGSPACPVADQRRTVFALARAEKAIILTARGAEQHRSGTDTAQAWINLALALGLPGRPGSGWGTVTGQGNGQGGREHGQKADQLPGYRSLNDPAARAHVAAVWGDRPRRPADAREERLRAARRARHRRRRPHPAGPRVQRRGQRARRPAGDQPAERPRLPRRQRLLPLRDRRARRRRPAQRHVGGGGRHDDQPRGPGHPPPARRWTRRPASPTTCSSWRRSPTGSAPGSTSAATPRRSSRSCAGPAPAASADYSGISYRADRRRAGRLLAVPGDRATPARRGCSPTGSPPPTAGRGSCASSTSTPTSRPTPTTRTCSPPAG